MSTNPLRDLAAVARDIRTVGIGSIPINIERACLIMINQYAYHNTASIQSAIRVAKFARWATCEVYYLVDPNVNEATEALTHFSTSVRKFSFIYFSGNPISQDTIDAKAVIKCSNGTIGPNLIYSTIDQKPGDLKLVICVDGINNPELWDPKDQDLTMEHVAFFAPYPDPEQAHLQQLDLQNETIFINEFWNAIKTAPSSTLKDIYNHIAPELNVFGQKILASTYPPEDYSKTPLVL
ncbi:hypothetical protein TVAG_038220 [Trichomonas vaginalis G3]|uniref:Uncharacterized protein n=1 Tax=Trichomonas vaginalis (strain ATCC PRA-98 / G3) TaxID=412133 RepID=A2DXY0_TRIV3|nr:hypothetical protein TVAGG3_0961080 [Trichomonas vaginalis G3]EAY14716.1 hypothetical protein TVAG_038220 [Trichomonas vaginalis G3]KAI5487913.1 hypothetical protein TVAGG3_0961080 [Trichomonas vaginalis G3]|eukprot:XP_001326939.1 hypothetical protein [Trichomonas vaginalis G3]